MVALDPFAEAGEFRRQLIGWGRRHFRSFPWRHARDPYRILLAEVMLHRTQVVQVVPIFKSFVKQFPSVRVLAMGRDRRIKDLLKPLGLRWRVALVGPMAREIVKRFGGRVPEANEDLSSLPGVSDYIANAVRCFAWNYPETLMDTNTVRVIGRVFGLKTKDSSRRSQTFRNLLRSLVDLRNPRLFNYALLDLAALVCTKSRPPRCEVCPVSRWCMYFNERYPRSKEELGARAG